jgi:hypothetical protein
MVINYEVRKVIIGFDLGMVKERTLNCWMVRQMVSERVIRKVIKSLWGMIKVIIGWKGMERVRNFMARVIMMEFKASEWMVD